MATTVPAWFQRFRSNLEITGLQQSTVSTRQQNVRDAVAKKLLVLDSFLTGSYRRHTMIGPLAQADIDIFVILNSSYYQAAGYSSLLDRVRTTLLETYTSTPKVSRNGQAVTITFTDFVVDVVPAFNRQGGGYLIPTTSENRWISTNPKAHEAFITTANSTHNGNLIPLVKMMKAWNREIGGVFRSFFLELLVERTLRGVRIDSDWTACRYFFDKARESVKVPMSDPAGLGNGQVAGFAAGITVTDVISRLQTALFRAQRAEQFQVAGSHSEAVAEWRKVFGSYFPAYG